MNWVKSSIKGLVVLTQRWAVFNILTMGHEQGGAILINSGVVVKLKKYDPRDHS